MLWKVLVIDQTNRPMHVVPVSRAIRLVLLGKAEIVNDEGSETLFPFRSEKGTTYLSTVIRVLRYVASKGFKIPFSRTNVFFRDDWTCQYCGDRKPASALTWDHVFPKCRGGKKSWENIVTACFPCNQRKRNRTPEEAGMKLSRKAVRPRTVPIMTVRIRDPLSGIPEAWRPYFGVPAQAK